MAAVAENSEGGKKENESIRRDCGFLIPQIHVPSHRDNSDKKGTDPPELKEPIPTDARPTSQFSVTGRIHALNILQYSQHHTTSSLPLLSQAIFSPVLGSHTPFIFLNIQVTKAPLTLQLHSLMYCDI